MAISIHAPGEGRDSKYLSHDRLYSISIHAPGEGRDKGFRNNITQASIISIHAPGEGRDA